MKEKVLEFMKLRAKHIRNDFERAEAALKNMTPTELAQPHAPGFPTRQEVLDRMGASAREAGACVDWVAAQEG